MNKDIVIEKEIINNDLCSVCGTCIGVCPMKCISVCPDGRNVLVNHDKCIKCNLCALSCPSRNMIFNQRKMTETLKYDKNIGYYEYFFKGYASTTKIRKNGASGGMITGLCSYLLDFNIVDKVLCAKFDGTNGEYVFVEESADLYRSQKSFYIPIPLNAALKEMKNSNLRYAVVGTPCQLQGLSKAINVLKSFNCKIIIKIGLMCGYIQGRDSIEYIADCMQCTAKEWKFIGWRCGNYPGYVTFQHEVTGEEKKLLIYDALSLAVPFFSLQRCYLCPDGTNDSADIVFGDVHAFGTDMNIGILRNLAVEKYLYGAKLKEYIEYSTKDQKVLYENAHMITSSKRVLVMEQIALRKRKGLYVPKFQGLELQSSVNSIIRLFYKKKAIMLCKINTNRNKKKILCNNYEKVLHVGRYIYHYPQSSLLYRCLCKMKRGLKR